MIRLTPHFGYLLAPNLGPKPIMTDIVSYNNLVLQMTAFIVGIVFYGQELDQDGIQNINGALFLILLINSYGNTFAVINVFVEEVPIFLREHFNGMYRTDAYFLTKQVSGA